MKTMMLSLAVCLLCVVGLILIFDFHIQTTTTANFKTINTFSYLIETIKSSTIFTYHHHYLPFINLRF